MAKTNAQVAKAEIQFGGIEILSCSLIQQVSIATEVPQYNFNIGVESKVDEINKIVHVIVTITITNLENNNTYGSISVNNLFNVLNLEEHITKLENGTIDTPRPLADMLNSIAISTTRGVMFGAFKGTALHFAFLPIVDPSKIQFE